GPDAGGSGCCQVGLIAPPRVGTSRVGTSRVGTSRVGTSRVGTLRVGTLWVGTSRAELGGFKQMSIGHAGTAPGPEQRSVPPKTDAPSSAPAAPIAPAHGAQKPSTFVPSLIVGLIAAAVVGLSIWYLVRPEPLLVQGEVDATRYDLAARVDGRVAEI